MKEETPKSTLAWSYLEDFRHASLKAIYLSTSRSGSSRIRFLSVSKNSKIVDITWAIACVEGLRFNPDYGCIVTPFMNMSQAFSIISNFNYDAASHDLYANGLGCSWSTSEGKKALNLSPNARVYDTYFFDANTL